MYTSINFKTKKALKEALSAGRVVSAYQPGGMFPGATEGKITLEGPHYPEPHKWYATATIKGGVIIAGSVK